MHDPFQNYANMGAPYAGSPYGGQYYGTPNPVGMPYNVQQASAINPLAGINPLAMINPTPGIPQTQQGYGPQQGNGLHPLQQLQLASLASQGGIPQLFALSPLAAGLQNPITAALLSNPLIAAGLHSQFGHQQQFGQQPQFGQPQFQQPQFGQPQFQQPQFGQPQSLYPQLPLAPQSWVGQGGQLGGGQAYGQINPLLAQLTARALQGQAYSPWGY
jgi:hypothetical protein